MKFGGAKLLTLTGYSGEKNRVRLASDTISTLQRDFKVKIDVVWLAVSGGYSRHYCIDFKKRDTKAGFEAKDHRILPHLDVL